MRKVFQPSGSPIWSGTPAAICMPAAAKAAPLWRASSSVWHTTTPEAWYGSAATLVKPRSASTLRMPVPSASWRDFRTSKPIPRISSIVSRNVTSESVGMVEW